MTLTRCKHGVYSVNGDGFSEYCSLCKTPEPLTEEDKHLLHPVSLPYYGEKLCPECGSRKFVYRNEWDFLCKECGANPLK